jgi:acetyltransferase-like isoleucine patch superfamily enzyme
MMISLYKRIKWWINADRIGPDVPINHWKLHFKKSGRKLCQRKFAAFGDGAEIRPYSYLVWCSKIKIGKGVVIRPNSVVFACENAGIIIEDYALLGGGVHIYTNNHEFSNVGSPIYFQGHALGEPVVIKKGAWIGANAIILPGVVIGENSVVGAGSIVTKSVPDYCVAVGNPAKVIKKLQTGSLG